MKREIYFCKGLRESAACTYLKKGEDSLPNKWIVHLSNGEVLELDEPVSLSGDIRVFEHSEYDPNQELLWVKSVYVNLNHLLYVESYLEGTTWLHFAGKFSILVELDFKDFLTQEM